MKIELLEKAKNLFAMIGATEKQIDMLWKTLEAKRRDIGELKTDVDGINSVVSSINCVQTDHEKNFNNIFERLKMLEEKQEGEGAPTFGEIDDLKTKIEELQNDLRREREFRKKITDDNIELSRSLKQTGSVLMDRNEIIYKIDNALGVARDALYNIGKIIGDERGEE